MDMSLPLFPGPPGYKVDLDHPQRTGQAEIFWVGGVGMVLMTFFLGMRIYTKTFFARNFSADDACLLIAWCFSLVIQSIIIYGYDRGLLGIHVWELSGSKLNTALNLTAVASIIYCPFLAFAKFSLLFFYLRLSQLRWFRTAVYANMFLVVGYNLALIFPLIFTCTPFMKAYDVTILEGSCIDRPALYMATAVLNMSTDIILLLLPIPMIARLQMPRIQKLGVICIFAVGSATCVTSAVRLVVLKPMLKSIDQTWVIVTPGLWILIEANLVIITGSLPVLRLFLRHVAPRLIGESTFNSGSRSRNQDHTWNSEANGHTHHQSELKNIHLSVKQVQDKYGRLSDDDVSIGSEERAAGWKNDASSETGIIPRPPLLVTGGILRTQSTVITSEHHAR